MANQLIIRLWQLQTFKVNSHTHTHTHTLTERFEFEHRTDNGTGVDQRQSPEEFVALGPGIDQVERQLHLYLIAR